MTYADLQRLPAGERYDITGCPVCSFTKRKIKPCSEHSPRESQADMLARQYADASARNLAANRAADRK